MPDYQYQDRPSESTVYKRLFKGALVAGALFYGYRSLPELGKWASKSLSNIGKQSPVFRSVIKSFKAGAYSDAASTIFRGIGNSSMEDWGWATSPIRHALGSRAPDILHDLSTTSRLLRGYGDPSLGPHGTKFDPLFNAWRKQPAARANQLSLGDVLAGNVIGLNGRPLDLSKKVPYGAASFHGGLGAIQKRLRSLEPLVASGRLPQDVWGSMLSTPVDRAIFKTSTGKMANLSSLDPRHWALNLWNRFEIPHFKWPKHTPFVGGKQFFLSGTRPFSWLTQLLFPTEVLRRQPIARAVSVLERGGKFRNFLALNGNLHRFSIQELENRPISHGGPVWRDIHGLSQPLPNVNDILHSPSTSGDIRLTLSARAAYGNRYLALSTSSLGKGVRLRTGGYNHSLNKYLGGRSPLRSFEGRLLYGLEHGLDKLLPKGMATIPNWVPFIGGEQFKVPEFLRRIKPGVGPHLTSPGFHINPTTGRAEPHHKRGAFEELIHYINESAYHKGRPHAQQRSLAAGERTFDHKFVMYGEDQWLSKQLGKLSRKHLGQSMSPVGRIVQSLMDFSNYSMVRPLYLLEQGLGIGIKPGSNTLSSMWKVMSRVALPAYAGYQGLRYADYLAGKVLPGGPPSNMVLNAYAGTQVLRQKGMEATGLDRVARRADEIFPGAIKSPLSSLGRAFGGGILGAKIAGAILTGNVATQSGAFGSVIKSGAALLGAAVGTFLGGADPTVSSERLQRIYSGEELVAVKRGRHWEGGKDSFSGRETMYYRPHMIAQHNSDSWYASTYGSKSGYWSYGTLFPTPSNLFGIKPLIDPYHLENMHAYDRPFAQTGSMFGEVPFVGPILEATVGRIIKPARYHPLLAQSMADMPDRWAGDRGVPEDVGSRLHLPHFDPLKEGAYSRFNPTNIFGKAFYNATDWLGMQGFLYKTAQHNITGHTSIGGGQKQLQTSDQMNSTSDWYYGLELGGGIQSANIPGAEFLATELVRRFLPHRDRTIQQSNPIPNTMPEWLQGERSIFPGDRESYLEGGFSRGDPYSKIPAGDVRLPGPGYESVHKLHSGVAGQYDDVDRLLITEDVQPYSQAAKFYRSKVQQMLDAGQLNEYWTRQVTDSSMRREEKMDSKSPGQPNKWDVPSLSTMPVTVSKVLSPTEFKTLELPYSVKLAGLSTDTLKLSSQMVADTNAKTIQEARDKIVGLQSSLRDRLDSMVGSQVHLQVSKDVAARFDNQSMLAIIPGLNQEFYKAGLGDKSEEGIAGYLRGSSITRHAANLYYGAASAANSLPGPLGWPVNKLLPMKDPVEDYYQFEVLSKRYADWETPVQSFLQPWVRQVGGFFHDFIPAKTQSDRALNQVFQDFRYIKAKRNFNAANKAGDGELGQAFQNELKHTPLGLNPKNQFEAKVYGKLAVSSAEQPYFDYFSNVKSTKQRERILNLAPSDSAYLLTNIWKNKLPQGEQTLGSASLNAAAETYDSDRYKAAETTRFLSRHDMPDKNWMGWDPRVSSYAVKTKWVENAADNIHNYGLWESEQGRYGRQFANINLNSGILSEHDASQERYFHNISELGMRNLDVQTSKFSSVTPGGSTRINVYKGPPRLSRVTDLDQRTNKNRVLTPEGS